MQVLFSRATQARTACRCFSCGRGAKTITRRSTRAATKRRIGVNDVFTACYSSLIASAVLADAEIKKERRKQWDVVIEEAKLETSQLGRDDKESELPATTYSRIAPAYDMLNDAEADPIHSSTRDQSFSAGSPSAVVPPFQNRLRTLQSQIDNSLQSAKVTIKAGTNTAAEDLEVKEWADMRPMPDVGFRDCKSRLHQEKMEGTISRLVKEILRKIKIPPASQSPRASVSSRQTAALLKDIRQLEEGALSFPSYTISSSEQLQRARKALNQSMYMICQRSNPENGGTSLMLAKICYNLLISSAPPSIITYNILLGEFTRLKLHGLAAIVIESFYNDTVFAPTMETTHLILNHYIAANDELGFFSMLNRMRCKGSSPHGISNMRLGVRRVKDLHLLEVQQWAMRNKVVHRNGLLFRLAPRDTRIFDSMIRGCLHFLDLRGAIRFLKQATRSHIIRDQWVLAIAHLCIEKLDSRAAMLLLQATLSSWKNASGSGCFKLTAELSSVVRQLLALCGIDGSRFFPSVNQLRDVPQRELHQFLFKCHMETLEADISSLSDDVAGLQRVVRAQPTALSGVYPASVAMPATINASQSSTLPSSHLHGHYLPSVGSIHRCRLSYIENRLHKTTHILSKCQRELSVLPATSECRDRTIIRPISEPETSSLSELLPSNGIKNSDANREASSRSYAWACMGNDNVYNRHVDVRHGLAL